MEEQYSLEMTTRLITILKLLLMTAHSNQILLQAKAEGSAWVQSMINWNCLDANSTPILPDRAVEHMQMKSLHSGATSSLEIRQQQQRVTVEESTSTENLILISCGADLKTISPTIGEAVFIQIQRTLSLVKSNIAHSFTIMHT